MGLDTVARSGINNLANDLVVEDSQFIDAGVLHSSVLHSSFGLGSSA
jgi:hypothetical protein